MVKLLHCRHSTLEAFHQEKMLQVAARLPPPSCASQPQAAVPTHVDRRRVMWPAVAPPQRPKRLMGNVGQKVKWSSDGNHFICSLRFTTTPVTNIEIKRLSRCTAGGRSDSKELEQGEPKGLFSHTKEAQYSRSRYRKSRINRKDLQMPSRISFLNTANDFFKLTLFKK